MKHISLSVLLSFILISCGGGGSDSQNENQTNNYAKLYDSEVIGVNFKSANFSGKTGENGFAYKNGDKVTFSIASITLGEVEVKSSKVFLSDLFNNTKTIDENTIKAAQLLQSLDNDKNDNKIIIDENKITQEMQKNQNIQNVELNSLNLSNLVDKDQAKSELEKTLKEHFKPSNDNNGEQAQKPTPPEQPTPPSPDLDPSPNPAPAPNPSPDQNPSNPNYFPETCPENDENCSEKIPNNYINRLKNVVKKLNNQKLYMSKDAEYYIPVPQVYVDANSALEPTRFKYTSDNQSVTINENGKVSANTATTAKITATYDTDENIKINYTLEVLDENVNIASLEVGQHHVLPSGSEFQIITPNATTLLRAVVYGNGGINAGANVVIDDKKFDLKCPSVPSKENLAKKASDNFLYSDDYYDISKSCYYVLSAEEAKALKSGVIVKFNINDKTYIATPKVSKPHYLKLELVKVAVNGVQAQMPSSEEDIKNLKKNILQTFPLSDVQISIRQDVLNVTKSDLKHVLGQMQTQLLQDNTKVFYGFVPKVNGHSGLAIKGDSVAVGCDKTCVGLDYIKRTFMHEIGHIFDLAHSPSGNGCSRATSGFWSKNLWKDQADAKLSPSAYFDKESQKINKPHFKNNHISYEYDLMSYQGTAGQNCKRDVDVKRFSKWGYQKMSNYMDKIERYLSL